MDTNNNLGLGDKPLLDVKNLKIMFASNAGFIKAVEGIDFEINSGECVAIVGESGCGKSVTALSIMRLLKSPPALIKADKFTFQGREEEKEILDLPEGALQQMRGNEITMIYQDPTSALNPVMTVGQQLQEVFIHHKKMTKKDAEHESIKLLEKVGLNDAEKRYKQFPHELSGGMKQRVLIAMATACEPKLLIADEPTTALDVTVQAQILTLLEDLRKQNDMSVMFITHDLGVVNACADRVYVMYCGKIMEQGSVKDIISNPIHPYTKGLIGSVPDLGKKVKRFVQIPKNVPHPSNKPSGCFFSNRCSECMEICTKQMPPLVEVDDDNSKTTRKIRCWKAEVFK